MPSPIAEPVGHLEHRAALTEPLLPELGPAGTVQIPAPPVPADDERGWTAVLLPAVSAFGMLGFALLSRSLLALALGGGFAVLSTAAAIAAGRHQRRRRRRTWAARCEHFRSRLALSGAALTDGADRQRSHALAAHPAPSTAAAAVDAGTVWSSVAQRRAGLWVRLGVGRVPALLAPRSHDAAEPGAAPDLAALSDDAAARYGSVDGLPVCLDLAAGPSVLVRGDLLPLVRALIVSLTRSVGPEELRLHVLAAPAEIDWIARLPHAGILGSDTKAFTAEVLAALRAVDGVRGRHVIVLAGGEAAVRSAWRHLAPLLGRADAAAGCMVGLLPGTADPPAPAAVVVSLDSEGCLLIQQSGERPSVMSVGRPDAMSFRDAHHFAATMQQRLPAVGPAQPDRNSPRLEALLAGETRHPLQLPVGVDDGGVPVTLDLREAARGGDGPHGLVVGATGSGKSELLRTLLTAAASQNDPQELTFLLVDFKGGSALSALSGLPHTAGLLTNLTADQHGVDRLCAALRAELRRRQRVLHDAGARDIDALHAARAAGSAAAHLPRLLVVVDEYAELIEQSPDALDVLTSVARLGRSLGIHLLLCSQRLDDGRLRGLEAHLRYRICLRTFSPAESLAVLGSADAAGLPAAPGWAYLSRDGRLTRLRVALSADPPAPVGGPPQRRARQLCPPPLPEALTLDGLPAAAIGLVDRPDLGQQPPLQYDLAAGGHLAVVGAPRSGRSTLLTTLVAALASATPARELAVHVVTPSGSPLVATAGLPHVGTVATTPELARRVVSTVAELVARRRAQGEPEASRVLLVIDDLAAVLAADEDLAPAIALIATAGQSVGVTLAVSCGRWAELRSGMREAMGTRFELACLDPADSMLPQLARTFPGRPAGRLMTGDGFWAQTALPRADGVASAAGLTAAVTELVAGVARRGGPATPPIQLLPTLVPADTLAQPRLPDTVALGVSGPYAQPATIDLGPGQHLLVLGTSGSGRSGLLRAVAASRRRQGARLWVIDPRRSFAGFPDPFRRACSGDDAVALLQELVGRCSYGDGQTERDVLIIDDLDVAAGRDAVAFLPLLDLLRVAADVGLSVVIARRLAGYGRAAYEQFFGAFLEVCENAVVLSGDPAEGSVIGGIRPRRSPPGRGQLVARGEPAGELQVAWLNAADTSCDPRSTKRIHTSALGSPLRLVGTSVVAGKNGKTPCPD